MIGVLLLAVFMTCMTFLYTKIRLMKNTGPFEELPTVPNAHWLIGHLPVMLSLPPSSQHEFYTAHSSPSGIVGVWGDFARHAFTVLRADHARAVLRQNSTREVPKLIIRHAFKTLGSNSLVFLPGGLNWKKHRSVIAKMFTVDVMREGKQAVADCSWEVVRWLLNATSPQAVDGKCPGHDDKSVYMEAENLFKLYSLEVFGKVSMGYEFKCFDKNTTDHLDHCHDDKCNCLKMSKVASSFSILRDSVEKRIMPGNILNPMMQSYSLPTKYNREYAYHSGVINDVMENVINGELDKIRSSNSKEGSKDQEEKNLITHLLRATLDDQAECGDKLPGKLSSGCPFSPSSQVLSRNNYVNLTTTVMTSAQKKDCIDKVSGILRTLLVAGFETTSISLTYVTYFLSIHPRCQELCALEADQVLGISNKDAAYNADFNPDDLVYCRAVFKEAIRLRSPVIFTGRVLEKDMALDTGNGDERVLFSKGTKAFICPNAIHHDERNFERATEFIPERWVRRDGENWVERNYDDEKKAAQMFADAAHSNTTASQAEHSSPESISPADPKNFFSFSDGARDCVGKRLAILESSVLIGMLFRNFRVEIAEKNFKLEIKGAFATVGPASLPVVFRRR